MNYFDVAPKTFDLNECSNEFIKEFCIAWRNRELDASDWTQLTDVDLANKWDWAVYRQELRDLPAQGADPKLWIFPVAPA